MTNYVLHSNKINVEVSDSLSNLFVNEWIIKINYSEYFNNCNPLECTYTINNKINYSYSINYLLVYMVV